ncbi:MAG TPA: hypothetical protein VK427_24755 [Kofleriaceae bacterium]|nr:hypothetical protein [Kofleriaceae bacterium]
MVVMVCLGIAAQAAEYNFYEQADKKGCASIITDRGQTDCAAVQRRKDELCGVPVECDPDRQEKTIAKYKEAKERLDSGKVNDSDRDKLKDTVRDLKDELDRRKDAARRGTSDAHACVRAREDVQKWFLESAIPLTERTRDEALRLRKDLLDRLADAQRKQVAAKSKRDSNPGDSGAQSEYDRASEEMRNAEKALEQFNNKYGKDIERYASRLIDHYKSEKESHERPLSEARNRVENCKKVDNMSY